MRIGFILKTAVTLALTLLFFVPATLWSYGIPFPGATKPPPPLPSISLIQSVGYLATAEVHFQNSIEGENGHWKGKWNLHGEVLVGVDLSKVTYVNTDPEHKQAVIRLPKPHLISHKVDHERSEEIYMQSLVWFPSSSEKVLRDEVWKMADRKIERLGMEQEYTERAKFQAERVLYNLFKGLGWQVSFIWQEDIPPGNPTAPVKDAAGGADSQVALKK